MRPSFFKSQGFSSIMQNEWSLPQPNFSDHLRVNRRLTMRSFFNFVAGAVMGALVGATTAILLAPSSGETLRGELRDRTSKFTGELKAAAETQRAELEAQLDRLKSN
jgi:hypothetical protein